MEYTTPFEQHSQATRLAAPDVSPAAPDPRDCHPLQCPLPGNLVARRARPSGARPQLCGCPQIQLGLFPLHSPLLGESLLVSFPPLIDMLKFGGYSCHVEALLCGCPRLPCRDWLRCDRRADAISPQLHPSPPFPYPFIQSSLPHRVVCCTPLRAQRGQC